MFNIIIIWRRVYQSAVRIFAVVFVADAVVQLHVDRATIVCAAVRLVAAVTVKLREGQQTDSGGAHLVVFATDTDTADNNATTTAATDV